MLNSTAKKTFALLMHSRLDAKENMQLDKALFESTSSSEMPVFRVYAWEPSFTYGVSQSIETLQRLDNLKNFGNNHAQRMTGGGILFHGNDISYSMVIPTAYVKNLSVKESYELISRFLLEFYIALGLKPVYAKDMKNVTLSKSAYCQEGFEPYDILVDGKKIGGNAQRRTKDVIFQHGSISIDNSSYSMGYSLKDLGISVSFEEAKKLLVESFSKCFNVQFGENREEVLYA